MPKLKLFLFGPPRLEVDGAPVEIERRKALALLVYLAVSGQPLSRDTLATLFWPDHSQSRARAYLRRDLAILNTSLIGDWLAADRDTVQFQNTSDFWLDTSHFHQLLAACRVHAHPVETACSDCLSLLTEAAELYTADFLAGFTLRDSPEFDDWQFFQTESFRQELALILERLARGYSAQGEFESAIPYARRWLALDPLHEPAQRQLIQLYDGAGQPAAALRQYEEYIKLLDEELGLPPEEETVTLYEAIKAKRLLAPFLKGEEKKNKFQPQPEAPVAQAPPEVDTPPTRLMSPDEAIQATEEPSPFPPDPMLSPSTLAKEPSLPQNLSSPLVIMPQEEQTDSQRSGGNIPFVGRSAEYEQLIGLVNRVWRKQGQIALIEGEAGIGKSRLAEEVAAYVQAHQTLVLRQKCYLLEQDLPYQVLIDLVGQILAEWPVETFQSIPPTSLAELALLVPEISSVFPQVAGATPGGLAETRQARLFRALQQFISAPTRENRALMLIIDDIHWADSITLQFLSYLAHHLANQALLLVCTYRAEEVSANAQLALTLQNLRREAYVSHLSLARLSLQDANTLVRSLSSGPKVTPLSQWLYQETEGNPFFLISILQSLQEQGILTADAPALSDSAFPTIGRQTARPTEPERGWQINLQPLQQKDMRLTLPEALRQSVRERLQRVPQPARQILDVAAVYGRHLDFGALQAITGENPPSLLNLVEMLMARQLFQEKEEDRAYDFSHDKIREVVYYDLSQMRRILLHRQVAESLEAKDRSRSGRLAEHFEKGEVWDKAIAYLAQAGNQARQLFTMEEALRCYDRAISLSEQHPEAISEAMRLDLYEQRGETRGLIGGQAEAAITDLQWVLEATQMAGDQERERALLIRIGQVYRYGDNYRQALTYLKEALEVARRGGDERNVADALYHLGATLWSQGHNDQALDYHQEAVDICQRLGLTDLVAVQAFHGLGEAYFLAGRAKEAIELYERSLKLARQIGDKGYEAENLGNMGMAMQLYGLADYERAKKTFTIALKISQAARLEWHSTQILGPLGLAFGLSGNYRQAFENLRRSLRIAEAIGAKRFHSLLLDMYGTLLQELGLPDRAKTAHENALALAQQADAGWWLPRIQANLLIDRLRLGDLEVETSLQTTFEKATARQLQLHALRCLEGLAELALAQDRPQQVLEYAGQLQRLAEPGEMREIIAQAHRWRGEALLALGQLEQAAAELEKAWSMVEMIGRPRLEADIASALGRVYGAQGDKEKALGYELQAKRISEMIAGNSLEAAPGDDWSLEPLSPERSQPTKPSIQLSLGQRFVQEELLTSGGMGQVYKGYDRETGRRVAIKRLKPELVAHNPETVKRFIREGEILRRLNHPNIVKVLATFETEDQPIMVMEYVSGGSLHDLLQQHPQLPLNRALSIGLELADALARVHYLNVIHRDLKPANILLAEDGAPRLTDFGVAYLGSQVTRLTQEGAILGTTVYMSPEAWRGEALDARSDIWSFGAVLYEMLAGQPPFAAEQVVAIMTAILTDPLPDLRLFRPETPPALVELIKHMLIKERDLRIDSMRQVAAGLELVRRYL